MPMIFLVTAVGYTYFDVFNLNSRSQRLQLVSPVIEPAQDRSPFCFTFWFSGFGADYNTTLKIFQRPAKQDSNQLINDLTDDILVNLLFLPSQGHLVHNFYEIILSATGFVHHPIFVSRLTGSLFFMQVCLSTFLLYIYFLQFILRLLLITSSHICL